MHVFVVGMLASLLRVRQRKVIDPRNESETEVANP